MGKIKQYELVEDAGMNDMPYAILAGMALACGNKDKSAQIVIDGLGYYAREIQKIVNATPMVDGVMLAAAMKNILAALEQEFDDDDKRMEDHLCEHMTVVKWNLPIQED